MALRIPNTSVPPTTSTPGNWTTLVDGGTPYVSGTLAIFNAVVEVSLRTFPVGGTQADWGPGIPLSPAVVPLATASGSSLTGRSAEAIYGIRVRQLPNSSPPLPPQVFGSLFQPGDALLGPGSPITSTLSSSGVVSSLVAGQTLAYQEQTGSVNITATTEATATPIVTAPSYTFDGSTPAWVEFFCPVLSTAGVAAAQVQLCLFEDGNSIGKLAALESQTGFVEEPVLVRRRLTPSAGPHVYSVRAFEAGGTASANAGAGGVGTFMPQYVAVIGA